MIKSLRTQLTLWYVAVLAAVLVLASVGAYYAASRILTQRMDSSLQTATNEIVESFSQPGSQSPESIFADKLVKNAAYPNRAIWLLDDHSRVIAEKPAANGPKLRPPETTSRTGRAEQFYELDESAADADDSCRGIVHPFTGSNGANYMLVVTQSTAPVVEALDLLQKVALLVVPLALLLATAGGWFLARRSLAPMAAMAQTARQITANNLDERLPVRNPQDEIGTLATLFNQVLDNLSGALKQQRQFMADASHELRTPLSVIRTAAEVTLEPARRQEGEYREALVIVKQQVQRLTAIVENMFALARAESGQLKLLAVDLYLDEIIHEVAAASSVLAARKQIKVETHAFGEAPFSGDEQLLRQMLMNLLGNAVKFTPSGGSVRISLNQAPDKFVIQVADTGSGISAEDQPHIFDRFFRADKARGAGDDGSAGLGLSIARSIAELHRGELTLAHSSAAGSTFRVSLPRLSGVRSSLQ
jgi:heavy metal sensor kinase